MRDLPIRVELQRSRLWVHGWFDDEHTLVAYLNSFDEEPSYGSDRIQLHPATLPAVIEASIAVHSIKPWQSPAWADPDAPIGRDRGSLTAEDSPRSYGEQEVLPDGSTRQLDDPLGWPPHRRADPLDWPPTRGE